MPQTTVQQTTVQQTTVLYTTVPPSATGRPERRRPWPFLERRLAFS
ncbi:MAG: hypothetical protein IIC64_15385 [SAR324 cluster bacterium]|nr:hypothetical protein [SAR324 cluster bacterium]